MKLSKTQLHKIGQSRGFFGRVLGPLLKTGLPLMKNVLKSLDKSVLIPLGLTAAASASAKESFWIGYDYIYNEEMNVIIKIVKSLEESGLLIKIINETNQNEAEEQEAGCIGMLLGTLGASLLEKLLTDKGVKRPKSSNIPERGVMRAGEGTIRTGEGEIRGGQYF